MFTPALAASPGRINNVSSLCVWTLEKWNRRTYLQGRNRDTDIKNECGHMGEGEGGMNWEIRIDIQILACVKETASRNLLYSTGSSAQCSVMT